MITPLDVLSISDSKTSPIAIVDVIQPIEFDVARSSASFRKGFETDTEGHQRGHQRGQASLIK